MPLKPLKKYSFLVDVNLPKRFSFFNCADFVHVVDVDPCFTDKEIWNYALKNNKVIITKDADFYEKSISSDEKPKVIFLQLGNTTLKELHHFFEINWQKIIEHLEKANLIIVKWDNIKVIT
ncbi:MAG: DUF5615 family PIN-like protein [Ignavibacteriaceae bacterium]|jgi:predicted nuclease of predicted toxin-antitoxin system|nr:DUF5615 family PIN-like protein [Ignavibacteriaceae bacterium]